MEKLIVYHMEVIVSLALLITIAAIAVSIHIFKLSKKINTAKTIALAGIATTCSLHLIVFSVHHAGEAFLSDSFFSLTVSESLEALAFFFLVFAIYAFGQVVKKHFK